MSIFLTINRDFRSVKVFFMNSFPLMFQNKSFCSFFFIYSHHFSASVLQPTSCHSLKEVLRIIVQTKKNVLMKTTKIRLCTSQTFPHRVFPSESSDFEEFSAMFFLLQVTSCFSVSSKDSSYFQSFFQF